jgi:hypothetical protein
MSPERKAAASKGGSGWAGYFQINSNPGAFMMNPQLAAR